MASATGVAGSSRPSGRMRLAADGTVRDSGLPDVIVASASQHAVEDLPAEAIVFLLGSRYDPSAKAVQIAPAQPQAVGTLFLLEEN